MKFKPVGHRILVELRAVEENVQVPEGLKGKGFIVSYGDEEKFQRTAAEVGLVAAIGPMAWKHPDLGGEPWCKVGDEVMFGKYAGKIIRDEDTKIEYMVLNDDDIQLVIERSA